MKTLSHYGRLAITRRAALAGASAFAAAGPGAAAWAQTAEDLSVGAPWRTAHAGAAPPLDAVVWTREGERPLRAVLAGRPAVINFWATWCPPCRREKPALNRLAAALQARGTRAMVASILSYDDAATEPREVIKAYERAGAAALTPLRATEAAETAFTAYFRSTGDQAQSGRRPPLPITLLVDAAGVELARIRGAALSDDGRDVYWDDPDAEALMVSLAARRS